jgi:hypothetical protein
METGRILSDTRYEPTPGTEMQVLLGDAFRDIVETTNIAAHLGGVALHESLARTNGGLLAYLKLSGMLGFKRTGLEIRVEELLHVTEAGFKAQPSFLVLELMYLQILDDLGDPAEHWELIAAIDAVIDPQSQEYLAYRSTHRLGR